MQRFWDKVDKSDGCWQWKAGKDRHGYGRFGRGGKNDMAHRVSWELMNGNIPDGMDIDHRCRNVACVRPHPDHCRLATRKQNIENHKGAQANSSTGVRGVYRGSKASGQPHRFQARVQHNRKPIHLGWFDTVEEAQAAAVAKRNELFTYNDADRS